MANIKYHSEEERVAAMKKQRKAYQDKMKVQTVKHCETMIRYKGMRATIGTFDKYNPVNTYWDVLVGYTYTKDSIDILPKVTKAITDWFTDWILNQQDDYDNKRYIKVINGFSSDETLKKKKVAKVKRVRIELTLLKKQPEKAVRSIEAWDEMVATATKHLDKFYEFVDELIQSYGQELKTQKGFNSKDYYDDD